MNTVVTTGIILTRINYGEADRILTFLTPDHGKVRALAKGVRKVKSKLAGGIELFSESNISYIPSRGEINTLISTRLITHYGKIVKDMARTNFGYTAIKQINKVTEDEASSGYYEVLKIVFGSLNTEEVDLALVEFWFYVQLLKLSGHTPNLQTDTKGMKLAEASGYTFNVETFGFTPDQRGNVKSSHIKFFRLALNANEPTRLSRIDGFEKIIQPCLNLTKSMVGYVLPSAHV